MAYADIIADREQFGAEARYMDEALAEYPDATDITEILIGVARARLRNDLYNAWEYSRTDTAGQADFEARVVDNTEQIQHALATLQIALFYEENDQGEGSLNREKWRQWRAEYEGLRGKFPGIGSTEGHAPVSTTQWGL